MWILVYWLIFYNCLNSNIQYSEIHQPSSLFCKIIIIRDVSHDFLNPRFVWIFGFNFSFSSKQFTHLLLLTAGVLCAGDNLALQGKATQSSLHSFGHAYHAIDGNRASDWAQASCIHTGNDFNPWLRVDLGKTHKVFSVNVTSYRESHLRLDGAEIRIGDSLDNNGNNNPRYVTLIH